MAQILATSLRQLPSLILNLSPEQQINFFEMIDRSLSSSNTKPASRQKRQNRQTLMKQLDAEGLDQAWHLADILNDMNIYNEVDPFMDLLKTTQGEKAVRLAYDISSLHRVNQDVKDALSRVVKITLALKTYAHHDHTGEKSLAQIANGLETVLTLYHNQLKYGIEVRQDFADVPPIRCYPNELNQVWTNLISNAIQAMENQGQLCIGIQYVEGDMPSESDWIQVSIIDSGSGIPDEIIDRIFDPFFTTKSVGEGSGLGLEIVHKIVDKHEGKIKVESEPGRTMFQVWLPVDTDENHHTG